MRMVKMRMVKIRMVRLRMVRLRMVKIRMVKMRMLQINWDCERSIRKIYTNLHCVKVVIQLEKSSSGLI